VGVHLAAIYALTVIVLGGLGVARRVTSPAAAVRVGVVAAGGMARAILALTLKSLYGRSLQSFVSPDRHVSINGPLHGSDTLL